MALRKMEEWDPEWAESCRKMSSNPWKNGVLSRKLIELICIGLNAAGANLNADGIQRHIRAALDAGATDSFPCFASVRRLFAFLEVNECNDSITMSAPVSRVDFGGANQPKGSEKGAEHADYRL